MIKLSQQTFRNHKSPGVAVQHLSLAQRILLGCDGTMTNLLEELSGETLVSQKVYEVIQRPTGNATSGPEWRRIVTLQGKGTGINYLYADSMLVPENLDPAFTDQLLSTRAPIGKLWEKFRVETYKTLLEWGVDRAGECADYFCIDPDDAVLYRSYQVLTRGEPVMMITEKFPRCWYTGVDGDVFQPRDSAPALADSVAN